MLLLRSLLRGWFVAELAMPNLAACVRDIRAASQHGGTEQNYCYDQRVRGPRPAHRYDNGSSAQHGERIKHVNQFLCASLMIIEPRLTIIIRHRQNTVVALFAEFVDRPCGRSADDHE